MTTNRVDGSSVLFIGVTRSGKSVPLKRAAEQHKRCLAYDSKGEMHSQLNFEKFTDKHEFLERLIEVGTDDAQIVFVPNSRKDFDFFCDCAFNFNRAKPCAVVCEELADCTNAGKADGYWGVLINQSLAYGITILATVQRGQEVDKTLVNNATFLHITRHATIKDQLYISSSLGIDAQEIPNEPLKFLQWSSDKGIVSKGEITFNKRKSKNWSNGTPEFTAGGQKRTVLPNGQLSGIAYR